MNIIISKQNKVMLGVLAVSLLTAGATHVHAEDIVDVDTEVSRCQGVLADNIGDEATQKYCQNFIEQAAIKKASSSEIREAKQAEISEAKAERRAVLAERVQERLTNLAANVSNRMDTASTRLTTIADRLDSRIVKLQDAGLDTTEAAAAMASARTSIAAAGDELATIDVTVNAAVTADNPREAWQAAKAQYRIARDHLRTAHQEMKAAVVALKAAALAERDAQGASAAVRSENADEANTDTPDTDAEAEDDAAEDETVEDESVEDEASDV